MALQHAEPGEVVNLRPLGTAITQTKTMALVKSGQFEAVRLVLQAGKSIPAHSVTGQITILCLEGQVTLHWDRAVVLAAGDWIYLDRGTSHSLTADRDSSLLLTIHFDQ